MNNLFTMFETDETKEKQGVWHKIGNGVEVKVARAGNDHFRATFRKLIEPVKHELRNAEDSDPKFQEIFIEAMASAILLDWKGVVDKDQNIVHATRENRIAMLTKLKEFRRIVQEFANNWENYKAKADAEALKN